MHIPSCNAHFIWYHIFLLLHRHSSRGVVMEIKRHVTPPIDAHQLRMIALAYAVSDDVNTLSDDDEDDEDRSSLYENSGHLHGNECHQRSIHRRYR